MKKVYLCPSCGSIMHCHESEGMYRCTQLECSDTINVAEADAVCAFTLPRGERIMIESSRLTAVHDLQKSIKELVALRDLRSESNHQVLSIRWSKPKLGGSFDDEIPDMIKDDLKQLYLDALDDIIRIRTRVMIDTFNGEFHAAD